ncbi:MAG: hypothetical protein AAF614_34600, partial [Chloroflexota bacterium]
MRKLASKRLICLLLIGLLAACELEETGGESSTSRIGQLFFIELDGGEQYLQRYDLETEVLTTLLTVPRGGWLAQTAVSPDGSQIAMAYAPPPAEGEVQF